MSRVMPHDIIKFGIIPELVGRLPAITTLQSITLDDMHRILTEPKNALLKQVRKQCISQGFKVSFTEGAVRAIAEAAMKMGVGARGLRSVVEIVMIDVQFAASPGEAFVIDEDVVNGQKQPEVGRI